MVTGRELLDQVGLPLDVNETGEEPSICAARLGMCRDRLGRNHVGVWTSGVVSRT